MRFSAHMGPITNVMKEPSRSPQIQQHLKRMASRMAAGSTTRNSGRPVPRFTGLFNSSSHDTNQGTG